MTLCQSQLRLWASVFSSLTEEGYGFFLNNFIELGIGNKIIDLKEV